MHVNVVIHGGVASGGRGSVVVAWTDGFVESGVGREGLEGARGRHRSLVGRHVSETIAI